jgi:hypothetical protein
MSISANYAQVSNLQPYMIEPEISTNGHNIKRVKTYKSLGFELDELLSWDEHIIMITEKVTKGIWVLRWLKSYLPLSVPIIIYKSLIRQYFDYCRSVWGNLGTVLGGKLQKLQNRAARIITGSDYNIRSL